MFGSMLCGLALHPLPLVGDLLTRSYHKMNSLRVVFQIFLKFAAQRKNAFHGFKREMHNFAIFSLLDSILDLSILK